MNGLRPEDLTLEHSTAKPVLPPANRAAVDWGLFDGPGDLAEHAEELLQRWDDNLGPHL